MCLYIIFVVVQGKKFAMNRQRNEIKERVPISAINLAYESDNDLHRLTASIKGMSVDITDSLIEETKRSALNVSDEEKVEGLFKVYI